MTERVSRRVGSRLGSGPMELEPVAEGMELEPAPRAMHVLEPEPEPEQAQEPKPKPEQEQEQEPEPEPAPEPEPGPAPFLALPIGSQDPFLRSRRPFPPVVQHPYVQRWEAADEAQRGNMLAELRDGGLSAELRPAAWFCVLRIGERRRVSEARGRSYSEYQRRSVRVPQRTRDQIYQDLPRTLP